MKIFFVIFILSFVVWSQNRQADPNVAKRSVTSTVIAPGCTEFVHPCSGQASTTGLSALTTAGAEGKPTTKARNSTDGNKVK